MARLNPARVNSPRQLAMRMRPMAQGMGGGQPLIEPQQAQRGYGGGGYGGYGGGGGNQWHTTEENRMRPGFLTESHAGLAPTADDVIKRQGGLSPGYGPSGINDLYAPDPNNEVGAFAKLQQSKRRAKSGDVQGADLIEKSQQQQGMGNDLAAQGLKDTANEQTAIAKGVGAVAPPPVVPPAPVPAQDQGGPVGNNMATVAEKEPETEFMPDGSTKQFTKPTLLKDPAPGIIVPNHRLRQFLGKFAHPSQDVSDVSMTDKGPMLEGVHRKPPAFDNGGITGLPQGYLPEGKPLGGPGVMLGGPGFGIQPKPGEPVKQAQPLGAYDKGGMVSDNSRLRGFLAKASAFDAGGVPISKEAQGVIDGAAQTENFQGSQAEQKLEDDNPLTSPPAAPAASPMAQPPQSPQAPAPAVNIGTPQNVPQRTFRPHLHSWEEADPNAYRRAVAAAQSTLAANQAAYGEAPMDRMMGPGENGFQSQYGKGFFGAPENEEEQRMADAAKYAAADRSNAAKAETEKWRAKNPRLQAALAKWRKGWGVPADRP